MELFEEEELNLLHISLFFLIEEKNEVMPVIDIGKHSNIPWEN